MPARCRALFLVSTVLSLACPTGEPRRPGVEVRYLAPSGAAREAGLRPGDRLLFFRRQAAPPANPQPRIGRFASCAELPELEVEEAPRGTVQVEVERRGQRLSVTLPPGAWKLSLAGTPEGAGCAALAEALEAEEAGQAEKVLAAYDRAARWGAAAHRPLFRALALERQGTALIDRNEFETAERVLGESLRLRRAVAPGSLAEAASWHALGRLERMRGGYETADRHFRKALALRESLAPESLERAFTLNNLGIVAWAYGKVEEAEETCLRALALVRRRRPAGLEEAQILNNLGLVERKAGNLEAAERYFFDAYRIHRRLKPEGLDTARCLTNLGALAYDRGNFALSESYDHESIRRFRAAAPEGLEVAAGLLNLGLISAMRQDLRASEDYFRRSLAIRRKLAPGTLLEAEALSALADTLLSTKKLDEAERFGRSAYEIRSRLAPKGDETGISLGILSRIALDRGNFPEAIRLASAEHTHLLARHASAQSQAHCLMLLGDIAFRQGDEAAARAHYANAATMRRSYQPKSSLASESLFALARVELRSGRKAQAESLLREALDALEGQMGVLGGTEGQLGEFEETFLPTYFSLIALQVENGDPGGALATLERSRARGLLALLAQRDLVFRADLPPRLRERQRLLDRQYADVQRQVASLAPDRKREITMGRLELDRLTLRRTALTGEIARASPRYAALSNPRPLNLTGVRRALDPGTAYLAYVLGETKAFLFVVTHDELRALPLATTRYGVAREVAIFRSLLLLGAKDPTTQTALRTQGRRLYDLLFAPAEPYLGKADRILISPDGALHLLPFGALDRADGRYLVEGKPLHTVVSATLYAELKSRRALPADSKAGAVPVASPRAEPVRLAAFAAPAYPKPRGQAGPDESPLRRYSLGLPELPGSLDEARSLTSLYGSEAQVYVGPSANERRATRLDGAIRIVHFASHALLDRHFPLDSALALAAPAALSPDGSDDGLLQAWEILERVRLDADLVTLSACETGLGGGGGGEGLIGLTRAFQYAGARSILASLWAVSDRSTAELMRHFYAALRSGLPKDEALRQAQIQMLRHADRKLSNPYHWAAFEMIGDWR